MVELAGRELLERGPFVLRREEERIVVDDEGPPSRLSTTSFFFLFFFLFFLPFFDFSPLRIPPRIERIANEWKIHVDAPDSSFLRTSKHVSSSSPCLASPRPFAPPRPSTPTSMPFCIPGAYHLRVRHPRNRSVSRNNTRCHGHPSIRQCIPMLPFSSPLRFTRSETIEDRNMGEAETTHS